MTKAEAIESETGHQPWRASGACRTVTAGLFLWPGDRGFRTAPCIRLTARRHASLTLVNYDMPWNPMRIARRMGRIDRVGQRHATSALRTCTTKGASRRRVYGALRGLFEQVVARRTDSRSLAPRDCRRGPRRRRLPGRSAHRRPDQTAKCPKEEESGFDSDAALDTDLPDRAQSPATLDDLDRVIRDRDLMPPGTEVQPLGPGDDSLLALGMADPMRVTTDAAHHEENPDSMELWSPGNPFFTAPEMLPDDEEPSPRVTLCGTCWRYDDCMRSRPLDQSDVGCGSVRSSPNTSTRMRSPCSRSSAPALSRRTLTASKNGSRFLPPGCTHHFFFP